MPFDDGRTVVTTAGTRVPLTATATPCSWVMVIALTSNTGQVNVGDNGVVAAADATERGVPLLARESVTLPARDVAKVFIDSRVNGEGVTYLYGAG